MEYKMKIGVSGDVGSFSEEAGFKYIDKANLDTSTQVVPLIDMDGVLSALNKGDIDIGIFPVVNNNSGLVWPAFVAMGKYPFDIIDELHLDIEQCLFAKHYMDIKKVSQIYSYPPAFNQCKIFLSTEASGIPQVEWSDMARAARDLVDGKLPNDAAVLGSKRTAQNYGLTILASNIQDVKPNITMFIVVTKSK